ncbi:hypothetical protein M8C21_018644 [Ambrosia artemisiifolia]|uniref:F-box domain-containing protein n=1 Tax=Ambrosia artemisiifolia TaxID=4212 RepID=A0AAD5BVT1_AMBAR|nr:hypothetical protein M8C21_018644 [Ambrosia artemisiifolia]
MENQIDFLQRLKPVMALKILAYLDDSADLIRASAVSRHWQNIVVSNGLSKQLCITKFPQLASITRVDEASHDNSEPSHNSGEREHRAYASLFRALIVFPLTSCIAAPVSASSTDNYPHESIMTTLDPGDKILQQASYWSSTGSDDSETPETLIYKLTSNLCVITEINLHPFQAYFQLDFPIYSSKYVRFRMGHPKSWKELDHDFMEAQECADDKFIWTYTSPIFPVARENRLQRFKLPEPAVCIGGFLQIEFVAHVQAIGRQLSPAFRVEFSEPSNSVSLKYNADEFGFRMRNVSRGHASSLAPLVDKFSTTTIS